MGGYMSELKITVIWTLAKQIILMVISSVSSVFLMMYTVSKKQH